MAGTRKNQQYVMLGLGVAAVSALGFVTFGLLGPDNPTQTPFGNSAGEIDVSVVSDRTSAAAPEMSWVTRSRSELENMRELMEDLRESNEAQAATHQANLDKMRADYDEMLVQQAVKIAELEVRANSAPTVAQGSVVNPGPQEADPRFNPDYASTGSEFVQGRIRTRLTPDPVNSELGDGGTGRNSQGVVAETRRVSGSFGQSFTLASLDDGSARDSNVSHNSLRNYIPAGSYAPAVVLSGADAATNVVDRENPTPVLFRITGPAVTAGRGSQGARINIRGCTVQGSAIGDLSAERVKVRLISLTCLKRNGDVVETMVSGYMTGSGKAGVRGHVVSREGNLVSNAAVAGVLQGLASAAQGGTGTDGAADVAGIAQSAMTAAGVGGVQQAATTLSEYYINRAEQYQPVISLHGGTNVELVFLEGISLK